MKPAAIATTLLLHAAAVGSIFYLQSEQSATLSRLQPFTITLVSSPGAADTLMPITAKTDLTPSRTASDQFAASDQPTKQQSQPDVAGANSASTPAQTMLTAGDASSSGALPSSTISVKTNVSIPAEYKTSNRKPEYPLISRKQVEEGTVLLLIHVKADGTAGEVRIKKSSGYQLLDESALVAVQDWRFHPASINNKPVPEWLQIPIPFTLHN